MNEPNQLQQILKHLKTLQGRGWNIRLDGFRILFGSFEFLATLDPNYFLEQDEWCIRGFIEREIEAKGLWENLCNQIAINRVKDKFGPDAQVTDEAYWAAYLDSRPTLLEVLQAAVEVTG